MAPAPDPWFGVEHTRRTQTIARTTVTRQQAVDRLRAQVASSGRTQATRQLEQQGRELAVNALKESSRRTHVRNLAWWWSFCQEGGFHPLLGLQDDNVLVAFVAYLYNAQHLPYPVLGAMSWMATIIWPSWRQDHFGVNSRLRVAAEGAVAMIRTRRNQAGVASLSTAPVKWWWIRLTPEVALVPELSERWQQLVIVATGVLGLMRSGSLAALRVEHVTGTTVIIKDSKTDNERRDQHVLLVPPSSPLSPVAVIASWRCVAHGRCSPEQPHIHGRGQVARSGDEDPFFFDIAKFGRSRQRIALEQGTVTQAARDFAERAAAAPTPPFDLPHNMCAIRGHSLRYGGAIALLEAGFSEATIRARGFWRSEGGPDRYLRAYQVSWQIGHGLTEESALLRIGDSRVDEQAGPVPGFDGTSGRVMRD